MITPQADIAPHASQRSVVRDEREVTLDVGAMGPQNDGQGRVFIPDRAIIHYLRKGERDWSVRVSLSGPRVLSTGVVSTRSRADRTYFPPEDAGYLSRPEVPQFLMRWVKTFWPEQ